VADTKEDQKLALFELYLATAEKVSDRRAQANAWMLRVNSAIVALYGYLQADKTAVGAAQKAVWLWAIPARGDCVPGLGGDADLVSEAEPGQVHRPHRDRGRSACLGIHARARGLPTRPPPVAIGY